MGISNDNDPGIWADDDVGRRGRGGEAALLGKTMNCGRFWQDISVTVPWEGASGASTWVVRELPQQWLLEACEAISMHELLQRESVLWKGQGWNTKAWNTNIEGKEGEYA